MLHSSGNQNPLCIFKAKIVPRTESGLPDDRHKTEAIALFAGIPVNYDTMIKTLRSGIEQLPENFNLFLKVDGDWTKIPRPNNNENDAELWDEFFVNQPKANRVLFLVDLSKVKRKNLNEKISKTELVKTSVESDTSVPNTTRETPSSTSDTSDSVLHLQELNDANKALKINATLIEQYKKTNEEQKQKIEKLETEQEAKSRHLESYQVRIEEFVQKLTEKVEKLDQFEKNHQLVKEVLECTVCYSVKKEVVFCGGCRRFTCCVECAGNMTHLECPTCRASWSAGLDREMGFGTNVFQDFDCMENGSVNAVTMSTETPNNSPSSSNRTEENLPRPVAPTLIVNCTACTVPASGGKVTFQLFNPGPQRITYVIKCSPTSNYTISPARAFIEAGVTVSRQLTRKAGLPEQGVLMVFSAFVPREATDAEAAYYAANRYEIIRIPVLATAAYTVTTLTRSSVTPITHSSNFWSNGTVDDFIRPSLIVAPTACTVPAAGGEVTFELINPESRRVVFKTQMLEDNDYTVSPAYAFIEVGATASLHLTRRAGTPQANKLVICSAFVSPDATDAKAAYNDVKRLERILIYVSATA